MYALSKFNQFVEEITASNGRKYKTAVLEKYKDDEEIKYYLNYLLNPYITTGISDKKFDKNVAPNSFIADGYNSINLLEQIKNDENTGTDHIISVIKSFIIKYDIKDNMLDTFRGIITKNIPLGIDAKTVNKVIPGLIPTFNVQLAERYFANPAKVEGKEFTLTTKIDGGRIIALKKNGVAKFYTRQGQEYAGLVDLKTEMENLLPDNICLDGEITLLNKGNLVSKDQYKQTMKITRADGEKHGVKMLVFDCMTADEFENQLCPRPYTERRKMLYDSFIDNTAEEYLKFCNKKYPIGLMDCLTDKDLMLKFETDTIDFVNSGVVYKYFNILPVLYSGNDTSKIIEWLNYNVEHGEEGVMININDAPYIFDRTWNLVKVKKMQDLDLKIIGFEHGDNKYSNTLGAIIVSYKKNSVKCNIGLGAGSDKWRNEIWNNKEKYLGKIAVVQYFEETTNDKGGTSLRFPVVVDIRNDKVEPDF